MGLAREPVGGDPLVPLDEPDDLGKRDGTGPALARIPPSRHYVLTCGSSLLARYAAADLRAALDARGQVDAELRVLAGGNAAWFAAGLPTGSGDTRLASPRTDRYRRPYEGTDASAEAMQAYLDWEFGLVDQLRRDGTQHFEVL